MQYYLVPRGAGPLPPAPIWDATVTTESAVNGVQGAPGAAEL